MLSHVVTLSDSAEPGVFPDAMRMYVAQDRSGRFFVAGGDRMSVFDTSGRLETVIGRRGAGPGEFLGIRRPLVDAHDSIHVLDVLLGRITVLTPSLQVARVTPTPNLPALILHDGTGVVIGQLPLAAATGYPMHVVTPEGRVIRSFGVDTPDFRQNAPRLTSRVIGPGLGGTVWTAAPGDYVLERWDPATGSRVERVDVLTSWFEKSDAPREDERTPPEPVIEGLWQDTLGFVWVLVRDKDANWAPPARANVERSLTASEYGRIYDWVLEVIDVGLQMPVASRRFDDVLWYRPPTALVTSPREDDSWYVKFDIWRPELVWKQ
jgi:hypothetical protein